jgi:hypothetical protein
LLYLELVLPVRERLRGRPGVELPVLAPIAASLSFPGPMALSCSQWSALFALDLDFPGPARVRVEPKPVNVKETDMRVVIRVGPTVAWVVDDLHSAVVARRAAPATGVRG